MKNTLGRCFYNALKKGDTKKALYILSVADDVDGIYRGKSYLTLAKEFKNKFVERALIKRGAIKEVSISEEEALSLRKKIERAVANADLSEFTELYVAGADLGYVYSNKKTLLMRAMNCSRYEPCAEIANLLIEGGVDLNVLGRGRAALHYAVWKGNVKGVKKLLEAGADVNVHEKDNMSPLFYVKDAEIAELLLDAGAEVSISYKGKKLIEYIEDNKIKKVIVEKIKERAKQSVENDKAYKLIARNTSSKQQTLNLQLIEASKRGDLEKVNQLIKKGANVNANLSASSFEEERTFPLIEAVKNGHLNVVKTLLANGANVNEEDAFDFNALMAGARNGNVEIIKTLLEAKAGVNNGDIYGCTALMIAMRYGNLEAVEVLVDAGANVDATDWQNHDMFYYAGDAIVNQAVADMLDAKKEENKKKNCITKGFSKDNDDR